MLDNIKKLADNCPCGHHHDLLTDTAVIGSDATKKLAEYANERYKRILFVCDNNTAKYLDYAASGLIYADAVILRPDSHANEIGVVPVFDHVKNNEPYDCLIACGSGSIHDITRYCADKLSLPFISYPTAASVDGFVSTVAAMTWNGQKLSTPAAPPVALFADDNVYTDAPARLTASGIGDILGKYTALCDWKIANILTGEFICPEIYGIMESALRKLEELLEAKASGKISENDIDYTHLVMESLVFAGLSMQLQGNSRPASGSEHHMSHLWEMHLINQPTTALHGEQVGAASLILANFYHNKLDEGYSFKRDIDLAATFDRSYIEPIFGELTDGILAENLSDNKLETSSLNFKITDEAAALAKAELSKLIEPTKLERYLKIAGAPSTLSELSLPDDQDFIEKSLAFAPYVRKRLTLLKILSAK
ncbi:MAG: sn-glycerol-1-phosphate dehydrogenase [Clostridiales bacterium]|nr:sn-glycerol-1-phosphate dehydrogenase [Clostridiales bacterium]